MVIKRILILLLLAGIFIAFLAVQALIPAAQAAVNIYASPVQAGCYRAKPDRCKIHVDPFTLNLVTGTRLAYFQLVATRTGTGAQTTIYDFRPDLSNPVPFSGSTFTPSLVAKDFAAVCGETYTVNLIGKDTGDRSPLVLGGTAAFTCPKGEYKINLPKVNR